MNLEKGYKDTSLQKVLQASSFVGVVVVVWSRATRPRSFPV